MSVHQDRDSSELSAINARRKAFRKAGRHTYLVRTLRIILPVTSLFLLASYGLNFEKEIKLKNGSLKFGKINYASDVLTAENPKYEGFNKDGGRYFVTARVAEQDIRQKKPIKLTTINGTMTETSGNLTKLSADHGFYDTKTKVLDLKKKIRVISSNGMTADLTQATVLTDKSVITSEESVLVTVPTGTVRGERLKIEQKKRQITFFDGVHTRLKPTAETKAKISAPKPDQADEPPQPVQEFGDPTKPTDITSTTLFIDDVAKTATFTGNVRAIQAGSSLEAPELIVHYENDAKSPDVQPTAAQTAAVDPSQSGRIKSLIARENVILQQATNTVTAKTAEFHPRTRTARLEGSVVVTSANASRVTGDRADIDTAADTALLTGNVVVTQERNVLRGRRLFVDRKAGTTQLTSPSDDRTTAAPITARLYQTATDEQQKPGAKGRKKSARKKPKPANTKDRNSVIGSTSFQSDPEAPIDIIANVFSSDDRTSKATFSGDVQAQQGNITLKSNRLIATYMGGSIAGATLSPEQSSPTTRITAIRAEENVRITSDADQQAFGDWADFDTRRNTVTLGGKVVLIKGKQVIRGPKLIIDLTSGISRMETTTNQIGPFLSTGTASEFAPGPGELPDPAKRPTMPTLAKTPSNQTECPPGRMCMLLYRDDPTTDPKSKEKPRTGSSGWSTTGAPPR